MTGMATSPRLGNSFENIRAANEASPEITKTRSRGSTVLIGASSPESPDNRKMTDRLLSLSASPEAFQRAQDAYDKGIRAAETLLDRQISELAIVDPNAMAPVATADLEDEDDLFNEFFDDVVPVPSLDEQKQQAEEQERKMILAELFAQPPFAVGAVFESRHQTRIEAEIIVHLSEYDLILASVEQNAPVAEDWSRRKRFDCRASSTTARLMPSDLESRLYHGISDKDKPNVQRSSSAMKVNAPVFSPKITAHEQNPSPQSASSQSSIPQSLSSQTANPQFVHPWRPPNVISQLAHSWQSPGGSPPGMFMPVPHVPGAANPIYAQAFSPLQGTSHVNAVNWTDPRITNRGTPGVSGTAKISKAIPIVKPADQDAGAPVTQNVQKPDHTNGKPKERSPSSPERSATLQPSNQTSTESRSPRPKLEPSTTGQTALSRLMLPRRVSVSHSSDSDSDHGTTVPRRNNKPTDERDAGRAERQAYAQNLSAPPAKRQDSQSEHRDRTDAQSSVSSIDDRASSQSNRAREKSDASEESLTEWYNRQANKRRLLASSGTDGSTTDDHKSPSSSSLPARTLTRGPGQTPMTGSRGAKSTSSRSESRSSTPRPSRALTTAGSQSQVPTRTSKPEPTPATFNRGRKLFSIQVSEDKQTHDFPIHENDDVELIAREIKVKFEATNAGFTDEWSSKVVELYTKKINRLKALDQARETRALQPT